MKIATISFPALSGLLALLFIAACSGGSSPETATLLLVNGNFFTADSLQPHATALAIRGERIVYVGDATGAEKYAGPGAERIDLNGAFAMPGFIEGHGHYSSLGRSLQNLQLARTVSWAEIVRLTAEKAASAPEGAWIEGRGWHQEKWNTSPGATVNGYPYHDDLSAATPRHPVVLSHASGHALMANARAMELAGVNANTPDPVGGRIVRDAQGRLTGVFEENAMELVERALAQWKNQRPEAEKQAAFDTVVALAARECLAKGITSFQDAGSDFWEIEQYRRLAEAGRLAPRLWLMIAQPKTSELSKLADFPLVGLGNNYLTVRAVKAYFDGALGSYGAWLLEPYADKAGHYGQNTTALDTLGAIADRCRAHGLQFCVHAIGDRANREVLNLFEARLAGARDARWRVEHAQHVDPADQPRFRAIGVIAAMQAVHCTSDAPFVEKRLGAERARTGAYPWRSLLDQGARLANGTDAPVEDVDPLPSLYAAVTRRPAQGAPFYPEQAMTREEALLSYTRWNAYAAFEEQDKGVLAPGMLADIAVLSEDLLRCAPEKILEARVLKTIVGGRVRYSR